jgi:transitional endoplasmic reticulum ATPase
VFNVDDFVNAVDEQTKAKQSATARTEQVRQATLAALAALGGLTVQDDALTFEGDKVILPEMYEGRVDKAIKFLQDWLKQQSQTHEIIKTFHYRPYDVAAAFERTLRMVFGTSGFGQTMMTMFGPEPPRFITVPISTTETIQVPWGLVRLPILDCTFNIGATEDHESGVIGVIGAEVPRKYRQHIEGFFVKLEEELRDNSIYKGKAIDGAQHPNFVSTAVDRRKVIYSSEVLTDVETHLWLPLRNPEAVIRAGLPIKRHVLIEGPFGTGKTLLGLLTAQEAVAAGFTFIQVRPAKDDLYAALKTARLYAPAVLWFEDLDTQQEGDIDHISKLLDVLDGMGAKGNNVMAAFTTNYVHKIQKGVMRPGRLDAVIHIGELDADGFERLCKAHIPEHLQGDIDYKTVAEAFAGFPPAFNVEAVGRALRYMLTRTGGTEESIVTQDLVQAANGLRRQLELMNGAHEGAREVSYEDLLVRTMTTKVKVDFPDGDIVKVED